MVSKNKKLISTYFKYYTLLLLQLFRSFNIIKYLNILYLLNNLLMNFISLIFNQKYLLCYTLISEESTKNIFLNKLLLNYIMSYDTFK